MKRRNIGKGVAVAAAAVLCVQALAGCGNVSTEEVTEAAEAVSDAASELSSVASALSSIDVEKAINAANAYIKDLDVDSLVQLGDYKGLEVAVKKPAITMEDVDTYLEYYAQTMPASKEVTGRPVQEGDTVNIAFAGRLKETDEYFDGGTSDSYDLVIGSHSFIDGFEDGLIGAEVGETRDLDLFFPEDYAQRVLAELSYESDN